MNDYDYSIVPESLETYLECIPRTRLEDYEEQYKEDAQLGECPLSRLGPKHLRTWDIRQLRLSEAICERVSEIIGDSQLDSSHKEDLAGVLKCLFEAALPLFIKGADANPIHHNVQTVENMLRIVMPTNEANNYGFVRQAAILALLHDVGNGLVDPGLKKIKSSEIADCVENMKKEGKPQEEINDEVQKQVGEAIEYREAHMDAGKDAVIELFRQCPIVSSDWPEDAGEQPEMLISECIAIHDVPSIAKLVSEIRKKGIETDKEVKDYLIDGDDKLAVVLREADRLWMLSREGLEKDLIDDVRKAAKEGKDEDVTRRPPAAYGKLKYNYDQFTKEYRLYEDAGQANPGDFQNKTLIRSAAGFDWFIDYVGNRINELKCEDFSLLQAPAV